MLWNSSEMKFEFLKYPLLNIESFHDTIAKHFHKVKKQLELKKRNAEHVQEFIFLIKLPENPILK